MLFVDSNNTIWKVPKELVHENIGQLFQETTSLLLGAVPNT